MTHEKIIKDQRGKIRIVITLVTFNHRMTDKQGNEYRYDVLTSVVPPRKRNEVWQSDIATNKEIYQAKLELWNKIKP